MYRRRIRSRRSGRMIMGAASAELASNKQVQTAYLGI
jgi:hypothetical protein